MPLHPRVRSRVPAAILGIAIGLTHVTTPASSLEPSWPAAVAEYRRLLADLVAIDSSNPPGNEVAVASYLKATLEKEGIACRIYESAPGRANLVARLPGLGRKRPLLLLGHQDVVGVERAMWSSDPFSLTERDGFLAGRGVTDDKGMLAAEAATLLWLKRLKVPLDRDVIFLAECDEESGGGLGVRWMLEQHRNEIDAELAINEGGRTTLESDRVAFIGVQTSEKRSVNYKLIATGASGHASMPRTDNCIAALARAIGKCVDPLFPVTLTPVTRTFFHGIAALQPPVLRTAMEQLEVPERAAAAGAEVGRDLMYNAMLRHTVSPTMIQGGFRTNVIPGSAEATLNCRLLPGTDPEGFRSELERRVADPGVKVTFDPPRRPEAPPVPFDGPAVDAVRKTSARLFPGAPVVPLLSTGATDSADLRSAGITAYGILPFPLTTEDAARMHGNDERMPVKSLEQGLRFLYGIVFEIVTPAGS